MNLNDLLNRSVNLLKANSPEILTALGVSGVITTSYLVGKASFKASEKLLNQPVHSESISIKEKVKLVWKFYIPAGISGVLTIGCIIGSSRVSSNRTTAALTAYSLTEKAWEEYKEKVVEQIGKNKEQKVRDEIAQDKVNELPPCERDLIMIGPGQVLCCELYTKRYFKSDMESLRKAQNDINQRIVAENYCTLEDFYDLVGLSYTSISDNQGWNSDRLMELEFSTVLAPTGEPCLAFNYNYVRPVR